jgi:glutathione S-transferase
MKLYFSPLACSLGARITCYEASLDVTFVEVDTKRNLCSDGRDLSKLNPLGQVPALELGDGDVLVENAAVLQFLAELRPEAELLPSRDDERRRLRQWLSLIGAELHKAVYTPLLDASAPDGAKAYALGKAGPRLGWLDEHLASRDFLLQTFSVADAYLFAVLNWSRVTPVRLDAFPALLAYQSRIAARPAVARALAEELALYRQRSVTVPSSGANRVPS